MKRVLDRDLDYPGDDGLYYFEGEPFTGTAYTLYPTGELKSVSEYRGGTPWGRHRKLATTGAILEEGFYCAGFQEGIWRMWHPGGTIASEEVCELDCPLSRKRWDPQGNLIEEFRLEETDPRFKQLQRLRGVYGKSDAQTAGPK